MLNGQHESNNDKEILIKLKKRISVRDYRVKSRRIEVYVEEIIPLSNN